MRHLSLMLSFLLSIVHLQAQTIARFEVDAGDIDRSDLFVNVPLKLTAGNLIFLSIFVPFAIEAGKWLLEIVIPCNIG
jgi:hypothetical protein